MFLDRACVFIFLLFVVFLWDFFRVFVVWFAKFCVLQCFSILAVPSISPGNSFVFCDLPLNFFCFPCYSLLPLGFRPAIPLLSLGSLLLVPPLQVSGAVTRLTVYRAPPHNTTGTEKTVILGRPRCFRAAGQALEQVRAAHWRVVQREVR